MTHKLKNVEYWRKIIQNIESNVHKGISKKLVKDCDYSITLPAELRQRVGEILPYEYDHYDQKVYIVESEEEQEKPKTSEDDDDDIEKKGKAKAPEEFNESTCSEIEHLENEFIHFELHIEAPVQRLDKVKKRVNWFSDYICKKRKERVKWNSKIYEMEPSIWEKTLEEQAEELMDASAERFTEWYNQLGSNHYSDISKEQLKSLFNIEGDKKLFASIHTEPKEVKAIAKTVADKLNMPEMATELKYETYVNDLLKNLPKKIIKVAFGRTVPYRYRPWVPSARDKPITTVFPKEILSGEKLFKGITHLRSTKAWVDFCREHPRVEKPSFLVQKGIFKHIDRKEADVEVPLYERLKLKY